MSKKPEIVNINMEDLFAEGDIELEPVQHHEPLVKDDIISENHIIKSIKEEEKTKDGREN